MVNSIYDHHRYRSFGLKSRPYHPSPAQSLRGADKPPSLAPFLTLSIPAAAPDAATKEVRPIKGMVERRIETEAIDSGGRK
jgi:hypothetical protein